MARIYTRTGDDGTTGLIGGARVSKGNVQMDAIGEVDELNATLGSARAAGLRPETDALLLEIQSHLFSLGAELASDEEGRHAVRDLESAQVDRLERAIDAMEATLEPLRHFILPAGTPGTCALHLSRAVARRAERAVVRLAEAVPVRPQVRNFLNRLSDTLFVAARYENSGAGQPETLWTRDLTSS